ncbi:hypothetical protein A5750_22825 [Mycobacterium sp. 852002-51613_SCH5001154]|nr:hypothetical protein A5750_22825 [Mycobacterium sp. 852002-51613_SCH5001154]
MQPYAYPAIGIRRWPDTERAAGTVAVVCFSTLDRLDITALRLAGVTIKIFHPGDFTDWIVTIQLVL